jgi:MarR family transcriptional regulator for hemolysin
MSATQERFSTALHNCARAWRQALDRRLKYLGVSQASWLTIAVAAQAAEPLSQSELADRLAVEGATMVAMIDRLVGAGLVLRVPSITDRRIKRVVLTESGKELYGKVKAEADMFRQQLLSQVPDEKVAAAAELLEQVHDLLERIP